MTTDPADAVRRAARSFCSSVPQECSRVLATMREADGIGQWHALLWPRRSNKTGCLIASLVKETLKCTGLSWQMWHSVDHHWWPRARLSSREISFMMKISFKIEFEWCGRVTLNKLGHWWGGTVWQGFWLRMSIQLDSLIGSFNELCSSNEPHHCSINPLFELGFDVQVSISQLQQGINQKSLLFCIWLLE